MIVKQIVKSKSAILFSFPTSTLIPIVISVGRNQAGNYDLHKYYKQPAYVKDCWWMHLLNDKSAHVIMHAPKATFEDKLDAAEWIKASVLPDKVKSTNEQAIAIIAKLNNVHLTNINELVTIDGMQFVEMKDDCWKWQRILK